LKRPEPPQNSELFPEHTIEQSPGGVDAPPLTIADPQSIEKSMVNGQGPQKVVRGGDKKLHTALIRVFHTSQWITRGEAGIGATLDTVIGSTADRGRRDA
jgi:hypothetical protein